MRALHNNERGAVLVLELIVLAVVLVAAGFAGYTYIQHNKHASQTTRPKPTSTPEPSPSPTPGVSPSPVVDTGQYLTIHELDIRMPLTPALHDLVYTYTAATATAPASLHFSTASVSAMPGGSLCTPAHDPLGSYTVYTSAQSNVGATDSQVGTLLVSANGYYIYYHHVQYACGDTPAAETAVANLIEPLHTAVQNAMAVSK